MSNPLDSKAVKGWFVELGEHPNFPLLLEGMRRFNRMSGWEQSSEWMEMKANGYRAGFEEAENALKCLVDADFVLTPEQSAEEVQEDDFMQDPLLADHAGSRF